MRFQRSPQASPLKKFREIEDQSASHEHDVVAEIAIPLERSMESESHRLPPQGAALEKQEDVWGGRS